ncbi:MAG: PAS domain S-box protein [Bacteroidota bacterium]
MMQLPNLLIVDDIRGNLFLIESFVKNLDVNLIQAISGAEALEKTKGLDLALAIVDVRMPEMDGYEFAVRLNGEGRIDKVPIIFVTASNYEEIHLLKGYDLGAVDYLTKPFLKQILVSKIKVFLDLFNQKQIIISEALILKNATQELTRVNSFLDSIVENIPNMIFVKDADDLRFVRFNKAGEDLLGISRDELLGKNDYDLFLKEQADSFVEKDKEVIQNKVIVSIPEEPIQTKHNGTRILQTKKVPILNSKGKPEFLLGISEDITELKRVIESQKKNELSLEEAQRIAHIGSWEWDLVGKKTKFSKEMFRIFDVLPEHYEGALEDILNIVHPDDVNAFSKGMYKNLSGIVDSLTMEYRIIHKDKSVHHIFSQGRLEYDKAGVPIKNVGFVQDVTERKKSEEIIKISEEKYKTMLNASPDGILLINLNGIITEVSEIGYELLGAESRDDIIGKSFLRFMPPDERNNIRSLIERTMNDGLIQNVGLTVRKKNKTIFAGETSVTLIQGQGGIPLSFMVTLRDISQRKKIETKQIHADRMASLGEMAAGMAHEINQPLNIISMVTDKILFETNKSDTISKEFLKGKSEKIFENITRIKNTIDHVRTFSRNHDDFILTNFDINLSIQNAVSMITEQFKYHGIDLVLNLHKKIPKLFGNTFKFEQVIINLLVNAKDAMLEKQQRKSVSFNMTLEIKSYCINETLLVEISDNGIGIEEDEISNILLPFYTTKEEGKGTGLGLSICYQIIKEMGGLIEISSEKFVGTTIKLVLNTNNTKKNG